MVHLYWIFGGRVGLGDATVADEAFQRPWFVVFNALAAAALLGLAALDLGTARDRVPRSARRLHRLVLWTAAVLLLARGGVGVAQWLLSARTDAEVAAPALPLYDVWFLLGGALHVTLAWLTAPGN